MQRISKLAMGSAMVVVVCLSLVVVLLLMLYVELCCSFLWRRRWRRRQLQTPLPTTAASCGGGVLPCTNPQKKLQGDDEVFTSPSAGQEGGSVVFSPLQKPAVSPTTAAAAYYYAHGVLQTPAGFFFTTVPHPAALAASTKQGEGPGSKEMPLHFVGVIPSPRSATRRGAACDSGSGYTSEEHFVCISNPIYEGACSSTAAGDDGDGGCTPFETPDTSPSRLEVDDNGDEDNEDEGELERCENSPALKPMKKLPPALPLGTPTACLADGRRSLATSMSVTDTNRPSSSSSSDSPGTSPSW